MPVAVGFESFWRTAPMRGVPEQLEREIVLRLARTHPVVLLPYSDRRQGRAILCTGGTRAEQTYASAVLALRGSAFWEVRTWCDRFGWCRELSIHLQAPTEAEAEALQPTAYDEVWELASEVVIGTQPDNACGFLAATFNPLWGSYRSFDRGYPSRGAVSGANVIQWLHPDVVMALGGSAAVLDTVPIDRVAVAEHDGERSGILCGLELGAGSIDHRLATWRSYLHPVLPRLLTDSLQDVEAKGAVQGLLALGSDAGTTGARVVELRRSKSPELWAELEGLRLDPRHLVTVDRPGAPAVALGGIGRADEQAAPELVRLAGVGRFAVLCRTPQRPYVAVANTAHPFDALSVIGSLALGPQAEVILGSVERAMRGLAVSISEIGHRQIRFRADGGADPLLDGLLDRLIAEVPLHFPASRDEGLRYVRRTGVLDVFVAV